MLLDPTINPFEHDDGPKMLEREKEMSKKEPTGVWLWNTLQLSNMICISMQEELGSGKRTCLLVCTKIKIYE